MKYLLWPPFAVFIVIYRLTQGIVQALWIMIWHFRIPTIREVYTEDGEYLFEDWSWKEFFRDILIYKPEENEEEVYESKRTD